MAYRFIEQHQQEFGLRWLLKRMGIYPNAYYNYLKHNKSDYQKKKDEICHEIRDIYHELGGILGHRSMRIFLARKQIYLSKTTIHKYMNKELHLHCICRRKRPRYKKGHAYQIFPNLLNKTLLLKRPIKSGVQTLHIFFLPMVLSDITVRLLTYMIVVLLRARQINGLHLI